MCAHKNNQRSVLLSEPSVGLCVCHTRRSSLGIFAIPSEIFRGYWCLHLGASINYRIVQGSSPVCFWKHNPMKRVCFSRSHSGPHQVNLYAKLKWHNPEGEATLVSLFFIFEMQISILDWSGDCESLIAPGRGGRGAPCWTLDANYNRKDNNRIKIILRTDREGRNNYRY